ncbi:uncharacterized protein EV420DRAFT_1636901 [Desarmillaria tabescens]|uniref:Uncharacterized protein n=1 Tax=Armillaria tabescens TaxID=1929756 RepID=A0AA39U3J0_ARMTA|nr:uncharacterized protein EV420DRAFT_1636901 [Desarmillaria tabescens]KAK0466320.1 hypothetical protein EV420DRAFT_1636901 [Desarmillaria tabescens]
MPHSEPDPCASSMGSILNPTTRSNSNSSALFAAAMLEKHPILIELEKWRERLFPPSPRDLFDESVDEATRQARQQAYAAKKDAVRKDVLEEYKKWWVDNAEALEEWLDSGEENEGPCF